MLSKLTSEHRRLTAEIETAVKGDDLAAVRDLDRKLVSNWKQIMDHAPDGKDEQRHMIEFLLERMAEIASPGRMIDEIKDKILQVL